MGRIIAVCTSKERGVQKKNVHSARLIEEHGLEGRAARSRCWSFCKEQYTTSR